MQLDVLMHFITFHISFEHSFIYKLLSFILLSIWILRWGKLIVCLVSVARIACHIIGMSCSFPYNIIIIANWWELFVIFYCLLEFVLLRKLLLLLQTVHTSGLGIWLRGFCVLVHTLHLQIIWIIIHSVWFD